MRKIFHTCIFFVINVFSILIVNGQNLESTFKLGLELSNSGNYEEAIYTFQRVIFFDEEEEFRYQIYPEIAYSYFYMGEYSSAAKYFDLAYFSVSTQDEKMEMGIQKSVSLIYNKEFPLAVIDLYDLPYGENPEFDVLIDFYLGVAFYGMRDFESSQKHFSQAAFAISSGGGEGEIAEIFEKVAKTEKIRPGTARLMSIFLPGSGQFYSGNVKSGFNSILLTGGFTALLVNVALNYTWIDAVVSVGPWLHRYWSGGSKNAERGAISKKEQRRARHYQEILTYFEEII